MRIAAVQITSTENIELNWNKTVCFIEEAVECSADIVALPENFAYLKIEGEAFPFAEEMDGEIISKLSSMAKKHKIAILAGSIPERINGSDKTYNTSVFINSEGKNIGHYRKIHLFDVELDHNKVFKESNLVESGKCATVIDTELAKIGITICYDLRFPELYRNLALMGAKIIFVPAAFTLNTGKDHWEILLRSRAIENQVYIVAPNQFGRHSEKRASYGHSMIIDPWGTVITRAQDKECIIFADIDFNYQDSIRKRLPVLSHIQKKLFTEMT